MALESIQKVLRAYESLVYPTLASCVITKRPRDTNSGFVFETHWNLHSPKEEVTLKSARQHFLAKDLSCVTSDAVASAADISRVCRSPSGALKAVVRDVSKPGQSKPSKFLEIWSEPVGKLAAAFDINARKVHGSIYEDDRLGGMIFSKDEELLLYIAERQREEGISYFTDGETDEKSAAKMGKGSVFKQSWGEQLAEKYETSLVVVDVSKKTLEAIPETVFGDPALCPGEFVFSSDRKMVVGTLYDPRPFKLGAQFCMNRKTMLYLLPLVFKEDQKLDAENMKVEFISGLDDLNVWSLRLTPDGNRVVFLANAVGGPHGSTSSMHVLDLQTKEVKTLMPVMRTMDMETKFAGLYDRLPKKCFIRNGDATAVAFTSSFMHAMHIYALDIDGSNAGKVRRLTDCSPCPPAGCGSWVLAEADWDSGLLLGRWADSLTPVELYAAYHGEATGPLDWKRIFGRDQRRPSHLDGAEIHRLFPIENKQHGGDAVPGSNAVLMMPPSTGSKSVPLICYPHGGPHSACMDDYSMYFGLCVAAGFAVLKINYRGSVGCGDDFVQVLPGKVGYLDVTDCQAALNHALEKFDQLDPARVLLHGGSHGGFLTMHLVGQYPDAYKAAIAVNPVTNLPAMFAVTDIPDWVCVEAGVPYSPGRGPPNAEEFEMMHKMSPVAYAESVKCPVLFLVGDKDLRVPPSQSYSVYYMLKARGVPVELQHFEDNHALSKPDVVPTEYVATILWMAKQAGCLE